ncbi:MAG: hypothetical protein ACE1Y7_00025, partial [Lysobacteraceae bacterium]
MNELNLEQVRAAMFTDPGVKAVDDLRLVAGEHGRAIAATITVAAPSVDLDLVHAVIAQVLADQFGIDQIMLGEAFTDELLTTVHMVGGKSSVGAAWGQFHRLIVHAGGVNPILIGHAYPLDVADIVTQG